MQDFSFYANSNDWVERKEWAKQFLASARNIAKDYILDDMRHPEHDAGDHDIERFVDTGFDQMSALQIRDYIESLREPRSYNQYEDPGPNINEDPWVRAMRAAYIIVWAAGSL